MSTARHHAEWMSLVEAAGPFLSLPVLTGALPQGLDAHDPDHTADLRLAHEEWEEDSQRKSPSVALHREWVRYVLRETLGYDERVLFEGQHVPEHLSARIAEHGETLRPDWVLIDPPKPGAAPSPRLLVQYVPARQDLEKPTADKRWKASPATRMMELLHATGVRLGLITNGRHWVLVNAPRGESAGFISWYSTLWFEEPLTLRSFRTLLGAERFFSVPENETLEALLAESAQNQQEVTEQLGFQVRKAVEVLVQAIDAVDKGKGRQLLEGVPVKDVYEAALTIMMRLVVLFSAEERKLLLLGDEFYDRFYALSTLREQLREQADRHGEEVLEFRYDAWCRLLASFRAVHGGVGHDSFQLPPYGGSLFDPDRFPFLEGRAPGTGWRETEAEPLPVNNRVVLHLLEALQVLKMRGPAGTVESRRVSFRSLDVEQIGHVYEGLLDHTAVRADSPVLGLAGAKGVEPEVELSALEREREKGEDNLIEYLREVTGRSEKALRRTLGAGSDEGGLLDQQDAQRLRTACDHDDNLFGRVRSFAGLMRRDTLDYPVVITSGSIYVTEGEDRRTTGTHYTPRSLTEEIVRHALEPLVYEGVAEGRPREEWRLRGAAELLALKVCDVACGSGAFLVQACRYLAERLIEAWAEAEGQNPGMVVVAPEGKLSRAEPGERPIPAEPEERLVMARRIVADRCLYGVDKNPMAVEMAKLSLWLVTMQKDRPFSFLDHAVKSGDSLLGVTSTEQLEGFALDPSGGTQIRIIAAICKPLLEEASAARRELESFAAESLEDVRRKEHLHARAEAAAAKVRFIADLLVGEALQSAGKRKKKWARSAEEAETEQDAALDQIAEEHEALEQLVMSAVEEWKAVDLSGDSRVSELSERGARLLSGREPFHWVLEFPEVFAGEGDDARGGFDAIVGNPPFIGGQKITGGLGTDYRDYLVEYIARGKRGSADLVAYFFLRAKDLLRAGGYFGLVATNTVAQGNTREVGLDQVVEADGTIYRAVPSRPWPGGAALEVAYVWVRNGDGWQGDILLETQKVSGITSLLKATAALVGKPFRLASNIGKSFQGSNVLGMGFVLSPEEAERLVNDNSRNAEVLFRFLNGEDFNDSPTQEPSRWVINFSDWPIERAQEYVDCFKIVREKVYPERQLNKDKNRRELWWRFTRPTPDLYRAISALPRALVTCAITKHLNFAFVPTTYVFNQRVFVFAFSDGSEFAVLQSTPHEVWAREYSSTLETRLSYANTDAFETFPFPVANTELELIGERYHAHRQSGMIARQEGLTKTYNRFHDQIEKSDDIIRLRELHVEMDNAVAEAYGWADLELGHGFHQTKQGVRFTISEAERREVLDRLLRLNHERYAEEVAAGLHDKGAKKKTAAGSKKRGGRKKQARPAEDSASEDAPGDGNLFDFERQTNLF